MDQHVNQCGKPNIVSMSRKHIVSLGENVLDTFRDTVVDDSEDLLSKKEFAQFQLPNGHKPSDTTVDIQRQHMLMLSNYQKFVNNFMSVNTNHDRLLLVHSTGVGKTVSALSTAFTAVKQLGYPINIFILGFTQSVFKKELLSRPEFGIVSETDVDDMQATTNMAVMHGTYQNVAQMKRMKRILHTKLRNSDSAHIHFIGYKMLVNRLFIKLNNSISLDAITTREQLDHALERGDIKENAQFTDMLEGSFIICDEIHNLYNSGDMNSWGVVLKYMIDRQPCKCIFASATPVNNRPHKIVHVVNLLTPRKTIAYKDVFVGNEMTTTGQRIITDALRGKISYIMDKSPENYPSMSFNGERLQDAPYLQFVKCPMSTLHENTLSHMEKTYTAITVDNVDDDDAQQVDDGEDDVIPNTIPLEGQDRYLNDMVFPNMESDTVGLWRRPDVTRMLNTANDEFMRAKGIVVTKQRECFTTISGDILSRQLIGTYSSKYATLIDLLQRLCVEQKGKTLVYHNFVQLTGTCLIAELLKSNGYIEYGTPPFPYTRCSQCYTPYADHSKDHSFTSLSFLVITGSTQRNKLESSLEVFNSSANNDGSLCKVLVGSKAIKEAYDFKAVRNVVILHQPENVSTLIQILGRAVRRGSHAALPQDQRHVDVFILVTTYRDNSFKTFEERKWVFKLGMYRKVQQVNNLLLQSAVDYDINFDTNFVNTVNSDEKSNGLYTLTPFRPKRLLKPTDVSTFRAYYYSDEVDYVKYLIKRCFIELSPVWTAESLWDTIRSPPFDTDRDTSWCSPHSFTVALTFMVFKDHNIVHKTLGRDNNKSAHGIAENSLRFLTASDSNVIFKNNTAHTIVHIGDIYILTEMANKLPQVKSSSRRGLVTQSNTSLINKPFVDYDFITSFKPESMSINIGRYLHETNGSHFDRTLQRFISSVGGTEIELLDSVLTNYEESFHKEFIELIIRYVNEWLRGKCAQSEHHGIFVKMLYFYNKFKCITFANHMTPFVSHMYEPLVTKTSKSSYTSTESSDVDKYEDELASSLEEEYASEVNGFKIHYKHYYDVLREMRQCESTSCKPNDYLLPTGHIFGLTYRVFNPETTLWDEKPITSWSNIVYKYSYKDAEPLVGYLEKDRIGVHISFKIRLAAVKNTTDKRRELTGVTCANMNKQEIANVCKLLGIDMSGKKEKKVCVCKKIKIALLKKELEERRRKSNKRYFYFYWENRQEVNTK